MQDENGVFNFIAAMEEAEKRHIELTAALPGIVVSAMLAELRRSVDFNGLARVVAEANTAVANVNTAADDANNAAATLRHILRNATIVFLVTCMLIPAATCAVSWWQTEKWRAAAAEWRAEAAELETWIAAHSVTVEALKDKTGGGVELVTYKDGTRSVILPAGRKIIRSGKMPDGREAIEY